DERSEDRLVPHSRMRSAIARRLTESKSTVPHFYLRADCRVDELLALRRELNELPGVRISVNDLVVRAVARAFVAVPEANIRWTEQGTVHLAASTSPSRCPPRTDCSPPSCAMPPPGLSATCRARSRISRPGHAPGLCGSTSSRAAA